MRTGGTQALRSPSPPPGETFSYRPGASLTSPAPIVETGPQQVAVIISKAGLRFQPMQSIDIDDIELQPDSLLVVCNSAEVKNDASGQQEVICHLAAVIKSTTFNGKAGVLRHKAGKVVLESAENDSLIARNKGNTTVFMLRAKKINLDLTTLQIEGSDGSVVQLKQESTPDLVPGPEATPPSKTDDSPPEL